MCHHHFLLILFACGCCPDPVPHIAVCDAVRAGQTCTATTTGVLRRRRVDEVCGECRETMGPVALAEAERMAMEAREREDERDALWAVVLDWDGPWAFPPSPPG